MLFVKERANVICNELRSALYRKKKEIKGFKFKEGFFITPDEADHSGTEFTDYDSKEMQWGGFDSHAWFRTEFIVPDEMDGKTLALMFSTQVDGWDAVNPQFLLFIDGCAVQGIDTNHRMVIVTDKAEKGKKYILDLQGYSGNIHTKLRFLAHYLDFNKDVYGLYMDIVTAVRIMEKLGENDKNKYDLESVLTETINRIDLRYDDNQQFYDSVLVAREYIQKACYSDLAGSNVTATAIGHTHIDVAWWWTVAQTREKAARSFATECKMLEEYGADGFKFMSSQPQLYKFVKEWYPELYDRIKGYIKEGRWEAEGGMWLEADCNIISGESMVRQFLHGKMFFKDEFGVDNEILWLPDVFGYSAALPQIMRKSGINYFMTTKIAWNQFNKLPCDTFFWRGIDGSEIFTHLITTTSPYQSKEEFNTTYNGDLHPGSVAGAWNRYQQKEINNDVLISYGHGDGGGGVTRDMIEQGIRQKNGIAGSPKVRFETAYNYFCELHERVKDNKRLPKWVGELYLEYHRGTYTSMARNKRSNRKLEFLLQDLEFISVWAERFGASYPAEELYSMWELVLRNQFHDILPGSSIKEVYEVTKQEYEEIEEKAKKLLNERLEIIFGQKTENGGITAVNTLHFDRDDILSFDSDKNLSALVCGDEIYAAQKNESGGYISFVKGIGAKGHKSFSFAEQSQSANNPLVTSGNGIETPFYSVKWNKAGQFVSLFDKENNREALKNGGLGNVLRVYEDKPMNYDNWDIDIYYNEKSWACDDVSEMEWLETGPVRATLLIKRKFMNSVISQKLRFYADLKRIDFDTHVDWKEHQCLLKTEFDVDVNTSEAVYDIQFGNISRPTHYNTSWDKARFEVCGHKFADLSEGDFGIALLNDCKYGYAIHDSLMTLSLVKSGIVPNPTTDQEEHFFTYSIMPHKGDFREGNVYGQAYSLNVPMYAVNSVISGNEKGSLADVQNDNVILETIKKSYDGKRIVIRMFENQNKRTNVVLKFDRSLNAVKELNLIEEALADVAFEGQAMTFEIKPYEIKTFEIEFCEVR